MQISYVSLPHNRVVATVRPRKGETIRAFVDRTGWEARGLPIVCAEAKGGALVPVRRADWGRKITKRDNLAILAMPLGGGAGKSIGALLAMIAVIALATFVAGPAGFLAGMGVGKIGLAIASAVIIAGGSFLISHFLSPKTPKERKEDDPLSISFGGNQARPQQPIAVHYGKMKFFPDYATAPWTDFRGKDQVFHGLFSLGVGEFVVHEIGFGSTPVWTASGGLSPDFPTFKHEISGPNEPVTLFPSNVAVSPDVTGQELQPQGANFGPFIINAPGTAGRRLSIDLVWPGGAHWTSSSGRVDPVNTTVAVEYRFVDDSGVPIGAGVWLTAGTLSYRFMSKSPVRKTEVITLPSAGRVQVRARRTDVIIESQGTNAVAWAGARLYLEGPDTRPHVTLLAVEAVSDRSLSSYNSQQVYVIATRKIPVWDGTTWADAATQNPVWAAVDMWHDDRYGGGQPRSGLDLETLSAMAAAADLRGDTFNHRFVSEMTVLEGLETIFRPILAQPVYMWDRLSAIRDEERLAPRMLLTDFEIIRGSVSISYLLQDAQSADGVIVEYLEEETWQRAEVGSAATLAELVHPARVQVPGVTKRRQAALLARYLAAVTRYRRINVSLEVEAEGKLLRRGDLVRVQTELPNTWGQAFRIDAFDAPARRLEFHEDADWTGGPTFYVLIRTATGKPFGPVKVTQGVEPHIAILDSVDLAAVETQQEMTLAAALSRPASGEYPTASFSAGEPREFSALVTRIANAGQGRFSLDLVLDAPEVYEIDDTFIPPLPDPPALGLPSVPGAIAGINARLEPNGLTLTLLASWRPDPVAETYTAQISVITEETVVEADREWITVYPAGYDALFQAAGFGFNDVYLRVRATSAQGVNGPWTQVTIAAPAAPSTLGELGLSISAEDILDGSISGTKFASGIEPVSIVASLPSATGYTGPLIVFNISDSKLYRYNGSSWTTAVTSADIEANAITAGKIAAGAVGADQIAANSVTADKIAVLVLSAITANVGTVTAGLIRSANNKMEIDLTNSRIVIYG